MNDQNGTPQDDELQGFDTFEDDAQALDDGMAEDSIDDADFQDISDDVDPDVFGDEEPAIPAKKKTNWFNIGVAVIAITVAGGLIWTKLGPSLMGGGDEPIPGPISSANPGANPGDSQSAAQSALAPAGANTGTAPGLLDNPDNFANLGTLPAPDMPAPSVNANTSDPFAGVPDAPTKAATAPVVADTTATTSGVPMPTPITTAPIETVMPEPVKLEQAATTATPAVDTAPVTPIAQASLENKVNALESRLDAIDSKLSAIQAPADDGRLNVIQTTLERLESRLDDMAVNRTSSSPRNVSADDVAPVRKAPVKKAAKPKPAPTQYDDAYAAPRRTTVTTTTVSTTTGGNGGWELRGATPGRATISKGGNIREVGVGETVPGLGEITGVAQINGAWVVQGTSGRLAQ